MDDVRLFVYWQLVSPYTAHAGPLNLKRLVRLPSLEYGCWAPPLMKITQLGKNEAIPLPWWGSGVTHVHVKPQQPHFEVNHLEYYYVVEHYTYNSSVIDRIKTSDTTRDG